MDLNLIKVFLSVYRQRSITRAAAELAITQPAVSAALKRLRTQVQRDLFVRRGRGVEPTAAAVAMAGQFASALDLIETATLHSDKLSVYCSEVLLSAVAGLDVRLKETPLDENQVLDQLRAQQVDLVLDTIETRDPSYVVEPFFSDRMVLICRQHHPRISEQTTVEQLLQEKAVGLQLRRQSLTMFELLAKQPLIRRSPQAEVASMATQMMLVASTDFISAAPETLALKWAEKLGLQVMPMPVELSPIRYQMIYLRRYERDAQHQAVREQVRQLFSSQSLSQQHQPTH